MSTVKNCVFVTALLCLIMCFQMAGSAYAVTLEDMEERFQQVVETNAKVHFEFVGNVPVVLQIEANLIELHL